MTRYSTICAAGLALVACPAVGQDVAQNPPLELACVTLSAEVGTDFATSDIRALVPVPFHVTNSDKQLKFYKARFEFGDSSMVVDLAQPRITASDLEQKDGPYGDLKLRANDDDIPTTFWIGETEYELQAVTPFYVKSASGDGKFIIDTDGEILVKAEVVAESPFRAEPVWTASCRILKSAEKA